MLNMLVATDLIKRRAEESHAPRRSQVESRKTVRPRRAALRSTSAAALRGLANLVEPSPSH